MPAVIDRRIRTEPTPEPLPPEAEPPLGTAEAPAVEPVEPANPFRWRDLLARLRRLGSHGAVNMELRRSGAGSIGEVEARAAAEEAGARSEEHRLAAEAAAVARGVLSEAEAALARQAAKDRELDSARRQLGEAERALSRAIENAEGDKTAAADCERQLIDLWSKPIRDPYAEGLCLQLSDFLVRARTLADVRAKAVEAARARVAELRQRVESSTVACG